jgi:hypothetical protein
MNGLDPDTQDTVFVDGAVPDPAHGFFYLMSTVDETGAEDHLGTTRDGAQRQPAVPCP